MSLISRTRVVLAAAAALALCGIGAQTASAYCTPSIFHPMRTTYSGLQAVSNSERPFGRPSRAVFNPSYTRALVPTITLTEEQTKSMTVSASVTVGASGLVASVEAQTGVDVSRSVSISTAVSIPVRIPPRRYGWVQAQVGNVGVQGTVTQVDMICNKVFYRGPISATFPVRTPYLVPRTGVVPPR